MATGAADLSTTQLRGMVWYSLTFCGIHLGHFGDGGGDYGISQVCTRLRDFGSSLTAFSVKSVESYPQWPTKPNRIVA